MAVAQVANTARSIRLDSFASSARRGDNGDAGTNLQRQGLLEAFHRDDDGIPQEARLHGSFPPDELLPLSSVPNSSPDVVDNSLTYLNCLALAVGIQIGSGIFSAPAVVSNHVPTPAAGIAVWAFAGVLVWTGASSFIELGTTVPRNGGMQEYLRAGYGDFAGFLFSCIWLSIVRPCSIAMIAMIFAEHVNGMVLSGLGLQGGWLANKVVALLGVLGITVLNCLGMKTGAKAAIWFLAFKLLIIFSIVVAGTVMAIRYKGGYLYGGLKQEQGLLARFIEPSEEVSKNGIWGMLGEYVTAGFAALWVYGGWEAVGFVVGEMKDPIRDLPRVLISSVSIVATSFTLTVAALYIVLPMSKVRASDTPVVTFGDTLYGPAGSLIYTIAICISALGALNANVFAVSRLAVAASRRDYIPGIFAGDNNTGMSVDQEDRLLRACMQGRWPMWIMRLATGFTRVTGRLRLEYGVPVYAMLLNALLATVYIVMGTFRSLLTFIGITEYLIFTITVLAIFRLRMHPPPNPPPSPPPTIKPASTAIYRVNSVNPVIFCVLSALLVGRGVVTEPAQGAALLVVFGVLWMIWRWKERRSLAMGIVGAGTGTNVEA